MRGSEYVSSRRGTDLFRGLGLQAFLIRRYREGDSKDWDRNLNFFV